MIKIEIVKSKRQYYFRIAFSNGRILCHSVKYWRKRSCMLAAKVIIARIQSHDFEVVDKTEPKSRQKP
jgi:uncharacterized protein YegP (UPF0339 family)